MFIVSSGYLARAKLRYNFNIGEKSIINRYLKVFTVVALAYSWFLFVSVIVVNF